VYQQLHALDCQHFVHYSSLVLFTYLRTSHGAGVQGFIFEGDLQFSKLFKNTICKGVCKVKCTEKRFIPFTPPLFSSLMCPP
jgi:hypothetical protein